MLLTVWIFGERKSKLAKGNSSAITFASVYVGWEQRGRKSYYSGSAYMKKLMEILSKSAVSCSLQSCELKIFVIFRLFRPPNRASFVGRCNRRWSDVWLSKRTWWQFPETSFEVSGLNWNALNLHRRRHNIEVDERLHNLEGSIINQTSVNVVVVKSRMMTSWNELVVTWNEKHREKRHYRHLKGNIISEISLNTFKTLLNRFSSCSSDCVTQHSLVWIWCISRSFHRRHESVKK